MEWSVKTLFHSGIRNLGCRGAALNKHVSPVSKISQNFQLFRQKMIEHIGPKIHPPKMVGPAKPPPHPRGPNQGLVEIKKTYGRLRPRECCIIPVDVKRSVRKPIAQAGCKNPETARREIQFFSSRNIQK